MNERPAEQPKKQPTKTLGLAAFLPSKFLASISSLFSMRAPSSVSKTRHRRVAAHRVARRKYALPCTGTTGDDHRRARREGTTVSFIIRERLGVAHG